MDTNNYIRKLPDPTLLPPDMVALPRWVTWQLTQDGKKIPSQKINDPHSWLTLAEALANPGSGGVGFVFTDGDDLGGVDLDSCRDPNTGDIEPWAAQILSMFDSYTEVSPSGTGIKIFAKGAPPQLPSNVIPIKEGTSHGGKKPQVECYVRGRFFAVTGQVVEGIDPQQPLAVSASAWLKMTELLSAMSVATTRPSRPRQDGSAEDPEYTPPEGITRGSRNLALTRLAGILRRQGIGVEGITASLLAENEVKCKPPLTRDEIVTIANSVAKYTSSEDTGSPFQGKIPQNSQYHIGMALDSMNIALAYNTFTDEPEITYPKKIFGGEEETPITEVFDEHHRRRLYFILERDFFIKTNVSILDDFIHDKCMDRPYHPVHQYLQTLKWDGVPRIEGFLETYMGVNPETEDTKKYIRAVSELTLMGAIRRIKHPGTKFDSVLVLEGPQAAGKSMSLIALSPEDDWILEDFSLGVDAKIAIERTVGKWIVEISEMVVSRSADINKIKAFVSLRKDIARKAYGRKTTKQPRAFIFIGTTNELHYLQDKSGNRRYLPVKVGNKIDLEAIRRDRDQLWAEAQHKEPGAKLFLSDELYRIAEAEQAGRETPDAWQDRLESLIGDGPCWVRLDSLWTRLDKPVGQVTSGDSRRMSMILARMGFKSTVRYMKVQQKGHRVWLRTSKDNFDPAEIHAVLPEDVAFENGNSDPIIYEKDLSFL